MIPDEDVYKTKKKLKTLSIDEGLEEFMEDKKDEDSTDY